MIDPKHVHETLRRHQLADGMAVVFDLERSRGVELFDARTEAAYLDFFTCFASWPVGYNHPLLSDARFLADLRTAAVHNPVNSDLYTTLMAEFVEAFATRATPPGFPHHFWVAGGALAVENALKAAFDWKAQREKVDDDGQSLVVLHFRQAFHGRSGYTLSVTNTVPDKIALYPKFCWPRVHNPAIELDLDGNVVNDVAAEEARAVGEMEQAFARHKDRVACILIEPMQGEGGDNHFRPEFLAELRRLADRHGALLVFDEVQTGFWGTGTPWLWQQLGTAPDIVAFGKKTQVCGIYSSRRIDEVPNNVFKKYSRINSTWGGNLVDMVRCKRLIEIIEAEHLGANVRAMGERMLAGLRRLAKEHGQISNVRGRGSLIAFTLETPELRQALLKRLFELRVLALPSGPRAIRLRMPLVINAAEVDRALERFERSLTSAAVT
jgi:L-lysine 6-transaminase